MPKVFLNKTVYDAAQERIKYIFEEFSNVLVAFSGGKDSGVLLNLCYDYAKKHGQLDRLAMYHLDYEAQYTATTDYVTDSFDAFPGIEKYWLCLPMAAQCAVNMSQSYWIPWDAGAHEIWAREMPENEFVINENNVPFDFKHCMQDYDLQAAFGKWFASRNGKTAAMIGIRSDESLNRFRAIASNKKVNSYKGMHYITGADDLYNAYPIYDWTVEDIWTANAKLGYQYNKLYDLFYQAGLSAHQMRVASPFNDCATDSLKLYKVVEPNMWAKLVGRVNGVNFAGIYGGTTAMGWKSIKLPEGHTWKSYLTFLLDSLPEEARDGYVEKFETSIKFWRERGGVLSDETIRELQEIGLKFEIESETNYKTTKKPVRFSDYPDDADVTDFKTVPSYKRMCICIMKNDHLCKYMGFSQTKKETEKRRAIMEKYKNIIHGGEVYEKSSL